MQEGQNRDLKSLGLYWLYAAAEALTEAATGKKANMSSLRARRELPSFSTRSISINALMSRDNVFAVLRA
jgi:hypothetical protein